MDSPKPATETIVKQQEDIRNSLPFDDAKDFEDAQAAVQGRLDPDIVKGANGTIVWNNDAYKFLDQDATDTVNPSLWRQSCGVGKRVRIHGYCNGPPGRPHVWRRPRAGTAGPGPGWCWAGTDNLGWKRHAYQANRLHPRDEPGRSRGWRRDGVPDGARHRSSGGSARLLSKVHLKALCAAEDATHTFHNVLTLRGALVRDPHAWARVLTETIGLFGGKAKVLFASHHWPTWGYDQVVDFLTCQRDLYAYVHDQILRLINKGFNGPEIAEQLTLPPALERAWNARGKSQTLRRPCRSWAMGRNGTWRNFYISGTTELRSTNFGTPTQTASADMVAQLTPEMLFDAYAIQINGPKAWDEKISINVVLTDGPRYHLWLSNGAFIYSTACADATADVTLTGASGALHTIAVYGFNVGALEKAGIDVDGDSSALDHLSTLIDPGDPNFNIVTP